MEHLEVVAQDYVRISLDFKHAAEKEASQLLQHLAVQVAGGGLKLWVGGLWVVSHLIVELEKVFLECVSEDAKVSI